MLENKNNEVAHDDDMVKMLIITEMMKMVQKFMSHKNLSVEMLTKKTLVIII